MQNFCETGHPGKSEDSETFGKAGPRKSQGKQGIQANLDIQEILEKQDIRENAHIRNHIHALIQHYVNTHIKNHHMKHTFEIR